MVDVVRTCMQSEQEWPVANKVIWKLLFCLPKMYMLCLNFFLQFSSMRPCNQITFFILTKLTSNISFSYKAKKRKKFLHLLGYKQRAFCKDAVWQLGPLVWQLEGVMCGLYFYFCHPRRYLSLLLSNVITVVCLLLCLCMFVCQQPLFPSKLTPNIICLMVIEILLLPVSATT